MRNLYEGGEHLVVIDVDVETAPSAFCDRIGEFIIRFAFDPVLGVFE